MRNGWAFTVMVIVLIGRVLLQRLVVGSLVCLFESSCLVCLDNDKMQNQNLILFLVFYCGIRKEADLDLNDSAKTPKPSPKSRSQ